MFICATVGISYNLWCAQQRSHSSFSCTAEPENVVGIDIPSINNPIETDDGVCHFIDAKEIEVYISCSHYVHHGWV